MNPFTDEELDTAARVRVTTEILLHPIRTGTQALSKFGVTVMKPIVRTALSLTDREQAIGLTFYRLLAAVLR